MKVFNAGAESALAESLPLRLHAALRRHPEAHALLLLLGTNDILAHLHPLPHHLLKLQARFGWEQAQVYGSTSKVLQCGGSARKAHPLVLLLGTNGILANLHPLPHHLLKLQA